MANDLVVNEDIDIDELDANLQPIKRSDLVVDDETLDDIKVSPSKETLPGASTRDFTIDPEKFDFQLQVGADNREIRAQAQTTGELIKGAATQALGEVVGGIMEGVGYLVDLPQYADLATGQEQEFGNWFSDLGIGLKTWTSEIAPIYQTKDAQTHFAPWDGTWWASHAPSIASTISLMVPAMGVTKGMSMLGKGMKLGKNLGQTTARTMKGINTAVWSRYMENTMESSQVFDRIYEDALNEGMTEDKAKALAGKEASKAWAANSANLIFDLVQYNTLFRGMKTASNAAKATVGKKALGYAGTAAQEGFEEFNQFLIQEEAIRRGSVSTGSLKDDGSTLRERIFDHMGEHHIWDAAFFGAIGGGIFHGIGDVRAYIKERGVRERQNDIAQLQAALIGDKEAFDKAADDNFFSIGMASVMSGTSESLIAEMENFKQRDDLGETEEDVAEYVGKIDAAIENVRFLENTYNNTNRNFHRAKDLKKAGLEDTEMLDGMIRRTMIGSMMEQRLSEKRKAKAVRTRDEAYSEYSSKEERHPSVLNLKKAVNRKNALKSLLDESNKQIKVEISKEGAASEITLEKAKSYSGKLEQAKKDQAAIESEIDQSEDLDLKQAHKDARSSEDQIILKQQKEVEMNESSLEVQKDLYDRLSSPETFLQYAKELDEEIKNADLDHALAPFMEPGENLLSYNGIDGSLEKTEEGKHQFVPNEDMDPIEITKVNRRQLKLESVENREARKELERKTAEMQARVDSIRDIIESDERRIRGVHKEIKEKEESLQKKIEQLNNTIAKYKKVDGRTSAGRELKKVITQLESTIREYEAFIAELNDNARALEENIHFLLTEEAALNDLKLMGQTSDIMSDEAVLEAEKELEQKGIVNEAAITQLVNDTRKLVGELEDRKIKLEDYLSELIEIDERNEHMKALVLYLTRSEQFNKDYQDALNRFSEEELLDWLRGSLTTDKQVILDEMGQERFDRAAENYHEMVGMAADMGTVSTPFLKDLTALLRSKIDADKAQKDYQFIKDEIVMTQAEIEFIDESLRENTEFLEENMKDEGMIRRVRLMITNQSRMNERFRAKYARLMDKYKRVVKLHDSQKGIEGYDPTIPISDDVLNELSDNRARKQTIWSSAGRNIDELGLITEVEDQRRWYRAMDNLPQGVVQAGYHLKVVNSITDPSVFTADDIQWEKDNDSVGKGLRIVLTDDEGNYIKANDNGSLTEDGAVLTTYMHVEDFVDELAPNENQLIEEYIKDHFNQKKAVDDSFTKWNYKNVEYTREELLESAINDLKKKVTDKRTEILEKLEAKEDVFFKVSGRSMGIPQRLGKDVSDNRQRRKITDNFAPLKAIGRIFVAKHKQKVGTTSTTFGNMVRTVKGHAYVEDKNGNVIDSIPRKLNEKEIDLILDILDHALNNNDRKNKNFKLKGEGGRKGLKEFSVFRTKEDTDYFLMDTMMMYGDRKSEEQKKYQIYFRWMGNERHLFFGKDQSIPASQIMESSALREFLEDKYHQVNDRLLHKGRKGAAFHQPISLNRETGVLKTKRHEAKDGVSGYERFLIENDIVGTDIVPRTELQYASRYLTYTPNILGKPEKVKKNPRKRTQTDSNSNPPTSTGAGKGSGRTNITDVETLKDGQPFKVFRRVSDSIVQEAEVVFEDGKPVIKKFSRNGEEMPPAPTFLKGVNGFFDPENFPDEGKAEPSDFQAIRGLILKGFEFYRDQTVDPPGRKPSSASGKKGKRKRMEGDGRSKPPPPSEKDAPLRRARKGQYKKADTAKEKAWFEAKFGGRVDYNVVKRLIEGRAWGQFRNAAVYIYENAEVGTTYHEAFHVVTHLFLTNSQRKALYNEYRRRKGSKEVQDIEHTVNRDLKNSDGSKRLASTNGKKITINPVNSVSEFFDYFTGKEGGIASEQKSKVLAKMAELGYSMERISKIIDSADAANRFLLLHEQDHIDNNDKDVYWRSGRDLLTEDKIAIEVRASINALKNMEVDLTDAQVEEALAEEFRDYVLSEGKMKIPTVEKEKKNFFERIWSMIKEFFVGRELTIQEVFENISAGEYAKPQGIRGRMVEFMNRNRSVKLDRVLDMTYEDDNGNEFVVDEHTTQMLIDGMNTHFMDIMFQDGDPDKMYTAVDTDIDAIYSQIFIRMNNDGIDFIEGNPHGLDQETLDMHDALYWKLFFREMDHDRTNPEYEKLKELHAFHLQQFQIKLSKTKEQVEQEERNTDLDPEASYSDKRNHFKESVTIDPKTGLPKAVRSLFSGIPNVDNNGDRIINEIGQSTLAVYDQVYNRVALTLSGTTAQWSEYQRKLEELASNDPLYRILLDRLESEGEYAEQLRTEFIQAMAKHRYMYDMGLIKEDGDIVIMNSNARRQRESVKKEWKGNLYNRLQNETGSRTLTQEYIDRTLELVKRAGTTGADREGLLQQAFSRMGMDFTYTDIFFSESIFAIEEGVIDGTEAVERFKAMLEHGDLVDNNVTDIFAPSSGVVGNINAIAEIEALDADIVDMQHQNAAGETVYDLSLNTLLSLTINNLNEIASLETREERENALEAELPHIYHSIYAENSLMKEKALQGEKITLRLLEAYKNDKPGEQAKATSELLGPDRYSQFFNSTLKKRYGFLRSADRSLENTIGMREHLVKNQYMAESIFLGYLKDEIKAARAFNINGLGKDVQYYRDVAGELRVFKGIIESDISSILNQENIVYNGVRFNTIEDLFENDAFADDMVEDINAYFERRFIEEETELNRLGVTDITRVVVPQKGAIEHGAKEKVFYDGISNDIIEEFGSLDQAIRAFVWNSTAAYIEQTKILTGDLALFKSPADSFKRFAMMNSTKKISRIGDDMDGYLNTRYERRRDKKTDGRRYISTIIFNDIKVTSDHIDSLTKVFTESLIEDGFVKNGKLSELGKKKLASMVNEYISMDETDAQGYITMDEYRDLMLRAGDWTLSHENLYNDIIDGKDITTENLFFFQPLKTQYAGPLMEHADKGLFINSGYKHSLMPLIPTMVEEGTNLHELMTIMEKNGDGIAQYGSASKFGTLVDPKNGKLNDLYNEDGGVSLDNVIRQTIDYKYFGIQVEIAPKVKNQVTAGSQSRKIVMSNLYKDGIPVDVKDINAWKEMETDGNIDGMRKASRIFSLISEYNDIQSELVSRPMERLMRFMSVDSVDGKMTITDPTEFIGYLKEEISKRTVSDNVLDALHQVIELDEEGDIFNVAKMDSVASRNKIENLLVALLSSRVIKEKRYGAAKAQAASTGFERLRTKSDEEYGSSELKFYEEKDGRITSMEVMIPIPKEILGIYGTVEAANAALDEARTDISGFPSKMLEIIGFRIPTQAMSSIESMRIKRFLPAEAGDIIVVPSEIVAKAGSDFDIDKITMYMPNFYNFNGKPKYIEYSTEQKDIQDRYINRIREEFSELSEDEAEELNLWKDYHKEKTKKEKDKLLSNFRAAKKAREKSLREEFRKIGSDKIAIEFSIKNQLSREGWEATKDEKIKEIIDTIGFEGAKEIADDFGLMSFEEFSDMSVEEQNSTKALQNRMIELHKDLLSMKENARQLMAPISNNSLFINKEDETDSDSMVNDIRTLKGREAEKETMTNVVEAKTNMDKFNEFLSGGRGVGQTAVHVTHHVLSQLAGAHIADNVSIYFDHNGYRVTGEDVGRAMPSLSGLRDVKGNYISETLSGFINAYVDIAKDPYIFDMNAGNDTANTIFYMIRLGVDPQFLARFMTQPVVEEYIFANQKLNSEFKKAKKGEVNKKTIVGGILKNLGSKVSYSDMTFNINLKIEGAMESNDQNEVEKLVEKGMRTDSILGNRKPSIKELGDNIKRYAENNGVMVPGDNAFQAMILDQFLEYERQAGKLQAGIAGSSFDTRHNKNTNDLKQANEKTAEALDDGFIGNYNRILENTFIDSFKRAVERYTDVMSTLFITEAVGVTEVLDKMKKTYSYLQKTPKARVRVMNEINNDFITFLIQTAAVDQRRMGIHMSQYESLFKGDRSVARELASIKEGTHPTLGNTLTNNLLIKELRPVLENRQDNIEFFFRDKNVHMENRLIDSFREIFNANPVFGKRLASVAIMQSGLSVSPISFVDLIPSEEYKAIVGEVIGLVDDGAIIPNMNAFEDQFARNNPRWLPKAEMRPTEFGYVHVPRHSRSPMSEFLYTKKTIKNKEGEWKTILQKRSVEPNKSGFHTYSYNAENQTLGDGIWLKEYYSSMRSGESVNKDFKESDRFVNKIC